jgi:hypothetical protein
MVTYTATVRPAVPGGPTPTGMVSFSINGQNFTSRALDANGQATVSFAAYAGSVSLTASYGGDGKYFPSTSPVLKQTTNKDATSVVLTAPASSSAFAQPFTVTATVTAAAPGSGPPSGRMTFYLDGRLVGSVLLNRQQASWTFGPLTLVPHTIQAVYWGDDNYLTNSSALLRLMPWDVLIKRPVVSL